MMVFRKAWNWLADFIGFVKKSAMLSAVRTKGTSISKDSTMSRMRPRRGPPLNHNLAKERRDGG